MGQPDMTNAGGVHFRLGSNACLRILRAPILFEVNVR